MNHIYRLVRSRITGSMIAVSELTKTAGARASRGPKLHLRGRAAALSVAMCMMFSFAHAEPTGGNVVAGSATINTNGSDTTINQSSQSAILNWQSFDIAAHESVRFVQPNSSAIALNRVLGADATQIMGNLSSNGRIFLINPNGVLFGSGAQVNVGGLVASARNITDEDFLSGHFYFTGSSAATVANYGSITANGGYVALLGAHVNNQGLISARLGSIALASGDALTLDTAGDGLLNVTVNAGAMRSLVSNGGLLRADGGQVVMTAQSASTLVQSVVNNTGVVQAQTIENHNGVIRLIGDMESGVVKVDGQLDASAPVSGNGGFIDTSAAHVVIAPNAQVTTHAHDGATGNWLIDPVDFTIAASGGNITGAQLSTNLAGSNITILSSSGASGVNGDINVNDTVTWSANQLTLSAYNNISINTAMNGSASASLALQYGQGAVAAGNASTVNVNAPVNLGAGNNFSTQLGSNGAVVNYTVITSLGAAGSTTGTDLQGINGNLVGNYVLGSNIDASATSGWNAGAGFAPIGNDVSRYSGTFDGLGHTVSGIYINRVGSLNFTGLIGYTAANSMVRNLGLVGGSVTSDGWSTGSMVGALGGTLLNSYATTNVTGFQTAGGLVGTIDGGLIDGSHASGTVVSNGNGEVGGLVGLNWGAPAGTVRNSYATGNVSSSVGNVGGLMGINWGTIINSYATGTTNGTDYVGGLVGNNSNGTVTGSYATGAASGNNYVGGLVGNNSNSVTNSYATGNVSGTAVAGGVAGRNSGTFTNNYATGDVSAANFTGGLIGSNNGTVSSSHASGNVTGGDQIAGLVGGHNSGSISSSYATGNVTATIGAAGGLVGYSAAPISGSYASGAVSGINQVGGILGAMNGSSITDSYAIGNVTGTGSVGGAVGNSTNGTITRAYSGGAVSGTTNVGGLLGSSSNATVNNSYWNLTTSGQVSSAAGIGLTTVQLQASLPTGFSSSTWGNGNNRTTPYLLSSMGPALIDTDTSATYYNIISTLTQLQNINTNLAGRYALINDIDASATSAWNGGSGFLSLGNAGTKFTGSFDGMGHIVSNLTINRPTTDYVGLFGYAQGSNVNRLGVANANIIGQDYVGALFGATVVGGVASDYSSGLVTGRNSVGGLIGYNNSMGLSASYSTSNVVGVNNVGGLMGETNGGTATTFNYATGNVTATGNNIGGLVGYNGFSFLVSNSYATGNVSGVGAVGGLVGYHLNGGIDKSYSTGSVTGTSSLGGLVGFTSTGTVTNSYWNTTTSGQSASAGGTGLTSAQMLQKTNFAGWDFTNTWIGYDGYTNPLLRTFMTSLTVTANDATKTYDGQAYNGSAGVTYSATPNMSNLLGTLGVTGGTNAGTSATVASGLYSTQQGYAINFVNGTLTTNRVVLAATASAANRAYDGTTTANATLGSFTGLVGTETIGALATASFNTKDVATANLVTVTGVSLSDGTNGGLASNYTLASGQTASANITTQALTATAAATNKTYDGTTTASATLGSITGLVGTETIGATATTASFNSKNVATANQVTVTGVSISDGTNGGLASNYSLASGQTASANITTKTLTASASANNKTYDGSTTATATLGSITGFVGTETVGATATATFNSKDVATANLATVNGVTLSDGANGGLASNYSLAGGQTASANITQRALTATASANSKVYDGSTAASATLGSITGLIGTETVGTTATATFNSKDVATANVVTMSGVSLSDGTNGGLASNYSIASGQTASANITTRALTAAASANDKTYDGSTAANATLSSITGLVGTETVGATATTANFNSKDVATANLVTVTGATLSDGANGGLASNYSLASGQTASANITQRTLTATASASNRAYDGTITATATLGSITGLVGSETVGTTATASFNTKDVATANLVTVNGVVLADGTNGGLASNYSLASGQMANANITQRTLTATVSATNRVYDGTTTASATLGSMTGLVGTETVGTTATASFNTKDVATANLVTVNGVVLADGTNGGLASNYSLASGQTASANITQRTLTATASATNRVYDGTTTASATLGSITGLVGSETVGATATASFNTKDVATANLVTVTGATLSDGANGGLASNYSLASGQTANANITQRTLTATASATNRVYDGTTTASATLGSMTGLVGAETVGTTATASFNTKDVTTANLVTVNGVVLADGTNGGLASNYTLASGQTANANITQRTLTATAVAADKAYDGSTAASATLGSIAGLIGTETVGTTITAAFNTKDVATANVVTVSGAMLSDGANGGLASNYSLASGQTANANITTRVLTATASANNKTYDGSTTANATFGSLTGLVGTETLGASATATFNSKDVAAASLVTVNTATLSDGTNGGLASNYSLASGQTANANITQRALTATASATNRVYDGTTTASATLGSISGLVGSETINTSATASFNSKDVATANVVTVNTATLSNGTNGGLASNYTLASGQTANANITQRTLTATASATNRVYDGTTAANATLGSITGLVGVETVGTSATATFNTKDVAPANLVTVNTATLSDGANGGLASNYTLASGQTANANITQRTLTATASATNRVYDGTTTASATFGSLTGLIGSETLSASATASFNTKDVATANLVTVNGVTLANGANGGLASNYTLASGQTANANITQRALSATAGTATRVYDGTTNAAATLNGITGFIGSETVVANVAGQFNSKDVATANLVTITGVTLSDGANGGLASNYSLVAGQTATGAITPRQLSIAGPVVLNRVYDGTVVATMNGGTLVGVVGGDNVSLTRSAAFATPSVGRQIAVTSSGSLSGADAANYLLVQPSGLSADILPVISAANYASTVSPRAAYESARSSALTNSSPGAQEQPLANPLTSSDGPTTSSSEQSDSRDQTVRGAPARDFNYLNLTIIGTGLNATELGATETEQTH
jgi:filamentous hemagglutinin family protein